jgi:hypothetical protein
MSSMNPTTPTFSDADLLSAFEDASLPIDRFHHAQHVRMAFLYLQKYEPLEAIARFSEALNRFAAAHGEPGQYHETITWAYLLLIRERLARAGTSQTWDEFAARNPDLLTWRDGILAKYYRPETLQSPLARRVFVFPNLQLL